MLETPTMTRAQFVEAAMHYSLNWRTSITKEVKDALPQPGMDPSGLQAVLEAVGPYNAFDPEEVGKVLVAIGDTLMGVELGRECSPVLYLSVPHWSGQMMGVQQGNSPLPQETREDFAGQALLALLNCKCPPDELSVEADYIGGQTERTWVTDTASAAKAVVGRKSITIRAWWD